MTNRNDPEPGSGSAAFAAIAGAELLVVIFTIVSAALLVNAGAIGNWIFGWVP